MTRHVAKLAPVLPHLAMELCTAVNRELARRYPDAGIGNWSVVDGTAIPAACVQRSAWRNGVHDPDLEAHYRRRLPNAAFRAYTHGPDGHVEIEGADDGQTPKRSRRQPRKMWRGFLNIDCLDAITQIPDCGIFGSASLYEPHALPELLDLRYELRGDLPKAIVADKLWDVGETAGIAEVRYGIHLVAVPKASNLKRGGRLFPDTGKYRGGIARISGDGIAYCRVHNAPLIFEGTELPPRDGLAPGEPLDELGAERHARGFRSRWRCPHGCGRLSLPTRYAWRALPYYPLTPLGRPDLYAMRLALLSRRNGIEASFSSLKSAYKQGLGGACRTRVLNEDSYPMLIWLAHATRALLILANERQNEAHGLD